MLDTLLEASDDRRGVFVWNIVSLVAAGLGGRARASARLSVGRTIAEAAKLASILYACLWLTAGVAVLIERPGWRHDSRVLFSHGWAADRPVRVVARTPAPRRRDRLRVHGAAWALVAAHRPGLLLAHRPDLLLPVSIVQPIVPAFGYLIMAALRHASVRACPQSACSPGSR